MSAFPKSPVLVIAAHPDDEVLGCGGAMARFADEGRPVHVLLLADGESSRVDKAGQTVATSELAQRNEAARKANAILGTASLELLDLPDNRLDSLDLLNVVKRIESVIARYHPATVLTHHSGDVNIDHRIVHDAVIAACRPLPDHSVRELLFFEIASSTEWRPPASGTPFAPNCFIDVSATLGRKLAALEAYGSELRDFPHPRSLRAVEALACWRGASSGLAAAEAFIIGRNIIV